MNRTRICHILIPGLFCILRSRQPQLPHKLVTELPAGFPSFLIAVGLILCVESSLIQ